MTQKTYHPRQPYKPDKIRRERKSVHKSRLPYWLAKQPLVQRFNRLSRKRKVMLLGWSGASLLVLIALFTTVYFASTLGSQDRIMNRNKTGVTLLDQQGREFYTFFNATSNTHVPIDQISPYVVKAAIASEDQDFYHHAGFSPKGIGNAVWQNIRPGGLNNGGSTITQQLVKIALLSEERSFLRKYQELVLSIEIERRYSKDEILEMYLNSVHFGDGTFGIEDAAQYYFGKPAKELDLAQASMLIGLLPSPARYSPITGDIEKARSRQNYVLRRMKEDGHITAEEKRVALDTELTFVGNRTAKDVRAPHFALMVKEELEKKYGTEKIARSGYTVKTTLNLDWQTAAENVVQTQVNNLQWSNVSNGATVVMDPKNGAVRALVGSADWNNETFGKFNITTSTHRQPGSSFKPLVYATGIEEKKLTAATILHDKPTDFGNYKPENYDRSYRGDVTLRRALANSLNIPAVEALQRTGIEETIQTSQEFGITTLDKNENYGLSLALGTAPVPLTEMTNAYATFANQGKKNDTTLVEQITDKNEKVIYTDKPENKQVISDQTAYIMSSMMSDAIARSEIFGNSLNLNDGRIAAVKTGTTEEYRDAWAIGYTPSLVVGAWVGNNDNSAMTSIAGATGAAPIWRNLMQQLLRDADHEEFPVAKGLTIRMICRGNGALASSAGTNTMTEYFKPGTLPTATCSGTPQQTAPPAIKPEESTPEETETDDDTPTEPITPEPEEPTEPETPEEPVIPTP